MKEHLARRKRGVVLDEFVLGVRVSVHPPKVKLAPSRVLCHEPRVNQRAKLLSILVDGTRPRRVVQESSLERLAPTATSFRPSIKIPYGFRITPHDKVPVNGKRGQKVILNRLLGEEDIHVERGAEQAKTIMSKSNVCFYVQEHTKKSK